MDRAFDQYFGGHPFADGIRGKILWSALRAAPLYVLATVLASSVIGQEAAPSSPYFADPETGIVYRKVVRTVSRPVVETKMLQQQQTVYQPKKTVETRPFTQRLYVPVTQYRWQPKVEGRWNPFRQPVVAYREVAETRWQSRDVVLSATTTNIEWTPETKTVAVPAQTRSMKSEQQVFLEPVGSIPNAAVASNNANQVPIATTDEIAKRLQPLRAGTPVQPRSNDALGSQVAATQRQPHIRAPTSKRIPGH